MAKDRPAAFLLPSLLQLPPHFSFGFAPLLPNLGIAQESAKQPRSSRRCPLKPESRDSRPGDALTDLGGKRNALGLIQILLEVKGMIQRMKKSSRIKKGVILVLIMHFTST